MFSQFSTSTLGSLLECWLHVRSSHFTCLDNHRPYSSKSASVSSRLNYDNDDDEDDYIFTITMCIDWYYNLLLKYVCVSHLLAPFLKELTCTHDGKKRQTVTNTHWCPDENYFTFYFALLLLFIQQQHTFTNKTFVIEYMAIIIKETI